MKKILVVILISVAFLLASCNMEQGNILYGTWECQVEEVTYRLDLRSDGWATFFRLIDGNMNSVESYQWYADEQFLYTLGQFNHYEVDEYTCDGKTLIYGAMTYTKK